MTLALPAWLEALRTRWAPGRPLPVWYHEAYRLPIHDVHEAVGIEPRRADLALWAMLGSGNRQRLQVHEATRIAYGDLGLVHTEAYLESLTRPASLAAVFGLHRSRFPVDPVLTTIRLACGGTLAAARYALDEGGPTLNLLGGFHHAFPDRGAGLCPVNDIAVAIAAIRAEGFDGQIVVLDLDAHPPDGTAACLAHDAKAWIGSISGSDWGELDGVDETFLPGADDPTYLQALTSLLARAPRPDLAFVLAGGDVLAGDRMGALALTLEGARRRDQRIARWLDDTPSVWLPAGGYQDHAWRVVAGTAQALVGAAFRPVPPDMDPVSNRFAYVSRSLDPSDLRGMSSDGWFTEDEIDQLFGGGQGPPRMLHYYTEEGIEYALYAFGFLTQLRRLGYNHFRVEIARTATGDRAQLTGQARGERHLLWEVVLDTETLNGERLLFLHWMTMRHPLGTFAPGHPRLPGQDAPGLGLAEEAVQLLMRVCDRLDLAGILLRPAWFHTAYMSRTAFRFVDPVVQGEFEALLRDLGDLPLPHVTHAIAEGRVRRLGAPWSWPAEPMVAWRTPRPEADPAARRAAFEAASFTIVP